MKLICRLAVMLFLFFVLAFVTVCNRSDDDDQDSADDDDSNPGIGQNPRASECGGFDAEPTKADDDDSSAECGDERLLWTYDVETQTVSFTHVDVFLNCCGERSIAVLDAGGAYEISETDAPILVEGEPARCGCMCLFDFGIDLAGVSGSIQIKITLDVTDDEDSRATRWEGGIDLTEGSGEILIQEDAGWCE